VVFWLDGVIVVPPLWQRTRAALEAHGVTATPELCFALIDLARELRSGVVSGDEYCRRAIERAPVALSPDELAAAIESRAMITPGIVGVIDELTRSYHVYLLADYPRRWLVEALSQGGLDERFAQPQIVLAEQYSDSDRTAAVRRMLDALHLAPEESLLIDADPLRGMAMLRAGLRIATFIDAPRLRREFVLRSMLPPRGPSHRAL
jgi:hypothetical protein